MPTSPAPAHFEPFFVADSVGPEVLEHSTPSSTVLNYPKFLHKESAEADELVRQYYSLSDVVIHSPTIKPKNSWKQLKKHSLFIKQKRSSQWFVSFVQFLYINEVNKFE